MRNIFIYLNKHSQRILLSLLMIFGYAFATGPSSVYSVIEPIAINEHGDVLCKSAYSQNSMGAHRLMPVRYALCLVKSGKISFLAEYNFESYEEGINETDAWEYYRALQDKFEKMQFTADSFLLDKHYQPLKNQGFKAINFDDYIVDTQFSLNSFQKKYQHNYSRLPQLALYLAAPITSADAAIDKKKDETFKQVTIQYKINNQLWLLHENKNCYDESEPDDMTNFYSHPYYDSRTDKEIDLEYEIQMVNSIIFLP